MTPYTMADVETTNLSGPACPTDRLEEQLKIVKLQKDAAEQETKRLHQQLQKVAAIAVDFNNVFLVIIGHTHRLLCNDDLDEELLISLRQINLAGERATRLLRDLYLLCPKPQSERQPRAEPSTG